MRGLLFFLISGIVVALGQPAWLPWLAPVAAMGGYALFWRVAEKIPSRKTRFFVATSWFTLVQLIQLSWMTSIEYQGIYILFVYGALALWLGAQFGLVTLLINRIPFVATAAFWTLMEWARLHVLCGFSWNPVGLALTAVSFSLQAASVFGILGLSFWVMLTNLVLWKKRWKQALGVALCPYLFGAIQWNFHRSQVESSPRFNIALVQTALLPSQKTYLPERASDFLSPYEQWSRITMLLAKIETPIDLIVLPEAAVPLPDRYPFFSKQIVSRILQNSFGKRAEKISDFEEGLQQVSNRFWIQALGKILHSDLIIGMDAEEKGKYFSSALFCSWEKEKINRYDKQILLPLAEYIPFDWLKALTRAYGITDFFTHGKKSTIFHSKIPIAASVCYEETFGHVMREGRKKGAKLFVNVTNDNWYPASRLPKQHFDLARVHAVANGIPLVRACNSGVTAAIDCLGRVVAELKERDKPGVLITQIPLYQFSTLYTFWGDWGVISVLIFLLIFCLVINRKSSFFNSF